jgi:hypothetical protein
VRLANLFHSGKNSLFKYLVYDYRSYLKPLFNTVGKQTAGMCEEVSLYRIPFYSRFCLDRFHCRWNIGQILLPFSCNFCWCKKLQVNVCSWNISKKLIILLHFPYSDTNTCTNTCLIEILSTLLSRKCCKWKITNPKGKNWTF